MRWRDDTAVKVDGEVVVLDLGLRLHHYVEYTQDDGIVDFSFKKLAEEMGYEEIGYHKDKDVFTLKNGHVLGFK